MTLIFSLLSIVFHIPYRFASATTTIAGNGGRALRFDGVDDLGRILTLPGFCGQANPFQFEDFTVEFWYYRIGAGEGAIFRLSDDAGVGISQYSNGLHYTIDTPSPSNIAAGVGCQASTYSTPPHTTKDAWVHVAFVYRAEAVGNKHQKIVYVDGELKTGSDATGRDNGMLEITCDHIIGDMGSSERYFVGGILEHEPTDSSEVKSPLKFEIDEFRVWRTGLSQEHIKARMHRSLAMDEIVHPDLVVYWDLNEPQGGVANDRTGNNLDLVLGYSGYEEGAGYLVNRSPQWVLSTAPLSGSPQRYNVRDYKDIEIPLIGWDPTTQRTVTTSASASAQVLSLPTSGTLSLTNGAVITATPFNVMPGNTLTFVPAPGTAGTDVSFTFTVSAASSQPSAVQTVDITIEVNHAPVVGNGGRALHFGKGLQSAYARQWGESKEFVWPAQSYETKSSDGTTSTVVGGGAFTVEWWGYQTREDIVNEGESTILVYLSSSPTTCKNTDDCEGQFIIESSSVVKFVYGHKNTLSPRVDPSAYYGRWVHWAMSTCGADPTCTEPHRFYHDGQLAAEFEMTHRGHTWKDLPTLTMGKTNQAKRGHRGIVDEFRLWYGYRTQQQLQEHMHTSLVGGAAAHPGLAVYYSFNDGPADKPAVTTQDDSGNGFVMSFGGGKEKERPPRVATDAPIGGYLDPIVIHSVRYTRDLTSGAGKSFQLEGLDPDGDTFYFYITALPARGTLWKSLDNSELVEVGAPLDPSQDLTFVPEQYTAGTSYASFTYEARDEERTSLPLEASLDVMCVPGTQLDSVSSTCRLCPVGFYNPHLGGTCVPCPADASASQEGQDACVCDVYEYGWNSVTETCEHVGIPCREEGCGEFATCEGNGEYCSCDSGYEMKPGVNRQMPRKFEFHCRLTHGSVGEKRFFWSICMCASSLSMLGVVGTVYQYLTNTVTNTDLARSYLAILLPGGLMSLVNFPFYAGNVLRGDEVDEGSCTLVGFLTYWVVVVTFIGPVIISYTAYKTTLRGRQRGGVPKRTLITMLACQWMVGWALSALVWIGGLLGSYRGLICYVTRMDRLETGGLMCLVLLASASASIYFAVKTLQLLKQRVNMHEGGGVALLRRGASRLVVSHWFLWCLFPFTTLLGFAQVPVPAVVEVLGWLPVALQPFVASAIVMSLPNILLASLDYSLQKSKGTLDTGSKQKGKQQSDDTGSGPSTGTSTGKNNAGRIVPVSSEGTSSNATKEIPRN